MEPDMNRQRQWQALLQELEQLEEQRSKEREEMQAWLQQGVQQEMVLDYPPNHSLQRLMSLRRISEESKRHIAEHQLRELQDMLVWLQEQPPQLQQPQHPQHLQVLQSRVERLQARVERLQARLQERAIPSDDSDNDDGGNGIGGAADGDNDGGD